MSHVESLTDQFVKLHAERVANWPPERLAKNIEQRAALVAAFDPAKVVKVGDTVAPFALEQSDGTPLTLDTLVAEGRSCRS
jgi:hypothetical protein